VRDCKEGGRRRRNTKRRKRRMKEGGNEARGRNDEIKSLYPRSRILERGRFR